MAHTPAIREINSVVDGYILKKKLPQDDFFVYLVHACDCFRNVNIRHSNAVLTTKIAVSSLGIIEMPSDMIGFGWVGVPINGEWWTFTKKSRKVMTTTTTGGVEGQDSTKGEGVDVFDDRYVTYGARGGVNAYYMNVDWSARRIFCDGFKSDNAVLQYTSSGLVVNGGTYVPVQVEPVIDTYLDWQKELNAPRSLGMLQYLEEKYKDKVQELRLINFMPSNDEIRDAWDVSSTQTVQR